MNVAFARIMRKPIDPVGSIIASLVILTWAACLIFLMRWELNWTSPILIMGVLIQTHLYTGLFITSHDAMHGTVSSNGKVNAFFGRLTAMLFAFNFYDQLIVKHHQHHQHVATDDDPDYYHSGHFWTWAWNFIKAYISLKQMVLVTVSLQLLRLVFPLENLLLFWVLPSILSTFQLFYFGTYVPHRKTEANNNPYQSGTLEKNHLWAFVSCYFFGYHFEHHDAPGIPWWRLWQTK